MRYVDRKGAGSPDLPATGTTITSRSAIRDSASANMPMRMARPFPERAGTIGEMKTHGAVASGARVVAAGIAVSRWRPWRADRALRGIWRGVGDAHISGEIGLDRQIVD